MVINFVIRNKYYDKYEQIKIFHFYQAIILQIRNLIISGQGQALSCITCYNEDCLGSHAEVTCSSVFADMAINYINMHMEEDIDDIQKGGEFECFTHVLNYSE